MILQFLMIPLIISNIKNYDINNDKNILYNSYNDIHTIHNIDILDVLDNTNYIIHSPSPIPSLVSSPVPSPVYVYSYKSNTKLINDFDIIDKLDV